MGYSENIVSSEFELIKKGIFPRSVHFDICKYEISNLIKNLEKKNNNIEGSNFSNWLNFLWREKEARLKNFYTNENPRDRQFKPSGKGYKWPVNFFFEKIIF